MAPLSVLLWFVFVAMVSCKKTTGAKDMVLQDRSGMYELLCEPSGGAVEREGDRASLRAPNI